MLLFCSLRKAALIFKSGILVGVERRVVSVLSESPLRGETDGVHWVRGPTLGSLPSLPCTLQGELPYSLRHFRVMAKNKRLGFQVLAKQLQQVP